VVWATMAPGNALVHRTLYRESDRIVVDLPLGDELGVLHPGGGFPLLADPRVSERACILGMFVLRPAVRAWTDPVLEDGRPRSMFEVDRWCFNVKGIDGGWPIAGGNVLDAYRLALQYGVADAVIVGSATVAKEGVDHGLARGHLWQPYGPSAWPRLVEADPHLLGKIGRLRVLWQGLGYLSDRRYPAQVVVSQSGEHREGTPDIFDARIFSDRHPDGSVIEVIVLSSEAGAERLRSRAVARGMGRRIDEMLLGVSPAGRPEVLDIARVPELLRRTRDIRFAEHDGGATVLSKFVEAGAVTQLNFTLMRDRSVLDILSTTDRLTDTERASSISDFDEVAQPLFSGDGRLPSWLKPVCMIGDDREAVVVTFAPERAAAW
jgi:riboflavin biosynthesis pyrimidine reductase